MTTDRERLDAIRRKWADEPDLAWLLDRAEEAIASRDRIAALEAEVERLEGWGGNWQLLHADAAAERDALAQRVTELEALVDAVVDTSATTTDTPDEALPRKEEA